MARDSLQLMGIYRLLLRYFGQQGWWPALARDEEERRFEVIAGAILTQNTSWKNVERALQNLRSKGLLSKQAMLATSDSILAKAVKPAGYYNQKAKKLKAFAMSSDNFHGKVTREGLLSVWGIGPETADSILLYAYEKLHFVIDAYTRRLISRLGYMSENASYDELQKLFHSSVPKDTGVYKEFHALIVKLGKEFCRKKPLCRSCPLGKICRFRT